MEVGQHDVAPYIPVLALKGHKPFLCGLHPRDAAFAVVDLISRSTDVAKVAQSVVRSIHVDVVNLIGLFAVKKEPSNTMRLVGGVPVIDFEVALQGQSLTDIIVSTGNAFYSANNSSFGVIAKAFTDRIRNNFVSHAENLLSVVRGLVVGATSTPIIPIVSNICIENLARREPDQGLSVKAAPVFVIRITL
jgi:hypothetical protein